MHLSKSVCFFYELKHFCLVLEFIKNCSVSSKEKGAATLNVGNRLQKVPMQCLDLDFLKIPIFQSKITKYTHIRVLKSIIFTSTDSYYRSFIFTKFLSGNIMNLFSGSRPVLMRVEIICDNSFAALKFI